VLVGVEGSLKLTVPSMNRLNQTDPAAFSILPFGPSLGIFFHNFILQLDNPDILRLNFKNTIYLVVISTYSD
jgi:hypothetical protein